MPTFPQGPADNLQLCPERSPRATFNNKLFQLGCLLIISFSSCKFRQKIPLVVHHAKIYTADDKFSVAEAMAISEGKIIAIGTNDEILKEYEGDEELNAGGKTIFPGFIDAHCHFFLLILLHRSLKFPCYHYLRWHVYTFEILYPLISPQSP